MNHFEHQMLGILTELKERHGAISVRAEFETEGTRMDELLRLKEIATRAGLGLTLKIGGCESVRDILESRIVGVRYLAAPMIESGFALRKYVQAVHKVCTPDELGELKILANIETKTGMERIDEILASPEAAKLHSVVVERVDLCFSKGMDADSINHPEICKMVGNALGKIKAKGIRTTVGGGVSADSLPFFKSLPSGVLDHFETRKVTFDAKVAMSTDVERALLSAVAFELFYLKNKTRFFQGIAASDQKRLDLIETRYWRQISKVIA